MTNTKHDKSTTPIMTNTKHDKSTTPIMTNAQRFSDAAYMLANARCSCDKQAAVIHAGVPFCAPCWMDKYGPGKKT